MSRASKALTLLAYNAIAAGLILLLLEGAIRMAVPGIPEIGTDETLFADNLWGKSPGPNPGASGTSNGATFSVTPDGFWKYEADHDADSLWLLLGDSVTMGIGVDPDSTFAGLLSAQSRDLRVVNPSTIGYSSRDYLRITQEIASTALPVRRITLFWCLNDVYEPETVDPASQVRRLGGGLLDVLRRHSRLYRWLIRTFADRPKAYYLHDSALYEDTRPRTSLSDLEQVQTVADSLEIDLSIIVLPYEYQLRNSSETTLRSPQTLLSEWANAQDLTLCDAFDALKVAGLPSRELYQYGDGIHFSPAGHRAIFQFVDRCVPTGG